MEFHEAAEDLVAENISPGIQSANEPFFFRSSKAVTSIVYF
jgi:hypothetical protein